MEVESLLVNMLANTKSSKVLEYSQLARVLTILFQLQMREIFRVFFFLVFISSFKYSRSKVV